jgi:O-antigen biosynthesis protein WbqV
VSERVEVKPVAIEDLLGRPQTVLDRDSMRALIHGANVLITGAGGSIGSELVRQISDFSPAHIALLDNSELHLYEIDLELQKRHPDLPRATIMADVRDGARIREIMATHRPALVFHAAAMKHVPMVEMNPCEGVLTNVIGTRNVADSCLEFGVKTMVLISTDKAVNPTSVMGATKRIAESYCQSLDVRDNDQDGLTRFVTVRFGNVLGSTGSVVPLFQRQLAAGGPLTVTDPNVTRYFMTVSEAVGLVLQASALGSKFTDRIGTIFVLEMGDPVRISDLANQMIRLAGLIPGKDIDVVFTGLRPGEKLFEEPLHISEELRPTESNGILLASPRIADETVLNSLIDELAQSAQAKNTVRARALIHQLIPEYQPSTGGSATGSGQSPANGSSDNEDTPVVSATATIAKFSEHATRQRAAR